MASIAHYCLHKLHMLPSQFLALDEEDKAFIVGSLKNQVAKKNSLEHGWTATRSRKRSGIW